MQWSGCEFWIFSEEKSIDGLNPMTTSLKLLAKRDAKVAASANHQDSAHPLISKTAARMVSISSSVISSKTGIAMISDATCRVTLKRFIGL